MSAAPGLRRPEGAWRPPVEGEFLGEGAAAAAAGEALPPLRVGRGDGEMAQVGERGVLGTLAQGGDSAAPWDGMGDELMPPWDGFRASTMFSTSSGPSTPGLSSGGESESRRLGEGPGATKRSSLLNPPSGFPAPQTPLGWAGWRPSSGQLLPPPEVKEAHPPTPDGLLRPHLAVLQWESSRSLNDHVDYSRLIGASTPVRRLTRFNMYGPENLKKKLISKYGEALSADEHRA
ncbi:hypothetical protein DFH09DRAFT_1068744 [Mycena vulgaris]|nr:hypothetical protein DFH09DRAFT_1068744 [Mycena vulgaris]